MDGRPARADELHHLAVAAPGSAWFETFALEFAAADASIAGYMVVTLRPSESRSWFWACVTGRDRPLTAVVENDAPLPRRSALELRAPGLWVDVECETPFDHVSAGLEAFGLTFDHPEDAVGAGRGIQTPVGFDLEWETEGAVVWRSAGAYEMPCRVTGEVLVADERHELEVGGRRSHCWGDAPWWRRSLAVPSAPIGEVVAVAPVVVPTQTAAPSVLRSSLVWRPERAHWTHDLAAQ